MGPKYGTDGNKFRFINKESGNRENNYLTINVAFLYLVSRRETRGNNCDSGLWEIVARVRLRVEITACVFAEDDKICTRAKTGRDETNGRTRAYKKRRGISRGKLVQFVRVT